MRSWSLSLVTGPTVEPISIDELKAHSHIDASDEDAYLDTLIIAARKRAETKTRRQLCTATWRLSLPDFPRKLDSDTGLVGVIRFPKAPLASVSEIQYVDGAGVSQTVASFQTNTYDEPGYICPAYGATWPSVRRVPNAVNITFVAGYGGADDVPAEIRHAIKFIAAQWFENREPVLVGTIVAPIPEAADALLSGAAMGTYMLDVADLGHT